MKSRLRSHAERRESLVARCTLLRGEARYHAAQIQRSLWAADLALEAGRAIKRRPLVLAAIIGALTIAQPARALRWLSKGLAAYSFVQNLYAVLRRR